MVRENTFLQENLELLIPLVIRGRISLHFVFDELEYPPGDHVPQLSDEARILVCLPADIEG
jgi:hypothetical protein